MEKYWFAFYLINKNHIFLDWKSHPVNMTDLFVDDYWCYYLIDVQHEYLNVYWEGYHKLEHGRSPNAELKNWNFTQFMTDEAFLNTYIIVSYHCFFFFTLLRSK